MNFDKLEIGKRYGSYRELIQVLGESPKGGNSKKAQLKIVDSKVDYHRDGHAFVIDGMKEVADIVADGRGKNPSSHQNQRPIDHKNLLVPAEDWDSVGVYKIVCNDNMYIGSTARGFRWKFMKYREKDSDNRNARSALSNGGTFEVLEVMNGKSMEQIRARQKEFILQYIKEGEVEIVNIHNTKEPKV